MKLYSYVVARDFGFAPNPFYGTCTLATCKPQIRARGKIGDWVAGTGSRHYNLDGHIVYAMQVAEILTFDDYWSDVRFTRKRPFLQGSLKQAYGDNIYHRDPDTGNWIQEDSHHSHDDGSPNPVNVAHDTKSHSVLIGTEFYYWGASGPAIPDEFRNLNAHDVCSAGRAYKSRFPQSLVEAFIKWIRSQAHRGYISEPAEFRRTHR